MTADPKITSLVPVFTSAAGYGPVRQKTIDDVKKNSLLYTKQAQWAIL